MTRPESTSVDQLTTDALEKALLKYGEMRLVAFGKKSEYEGLFPDEKGSRKEAIERCLSGSQPLLQVVRTEEVEAGDRKQIHRFVIITPNGIDHLFSKLTAEKCEALLTNCFVSATRELSFQQSQLETLVRVRQNMLANIQQFVQQIIAGEDRVVSAIHEAAKKRGMMKSLLDSLPVAANKLPAKPESQPYRHSSNADEFQCRRQIAQEVVFAWEEMPKDSREPIERALFNIGAEPIGRSGEKLQFDGQLHECQDPLFPGDPVEIVQPGWLLRDEQGGYLLASAKVKSLSGGG